MLRNLRIVQHVKVCNTKQERTALVAAQHAMQRQGMVVLY
jgi:hypothetical protein